MIDSKELRIGNWVIGPEVLPIKIFGAEGGFVAPDGGGYFKCEQINPILLTHEIISKCGFARSIDVNKYPNSIDEMEISPLGLRITYFKHNYGFDIKLKIIDDEGLSDEFDLHHINSLHQLQNLYYALTGEEIIYKP